MTDSVLLHLFYALPERGCLLIDNWSWQLWTQHNDWPHIKWNWLCDSSVMMLVTCCCVDECHCGFKRWLYVLCRRKKLHWLWARLLTLPIIVFSILRSRMSTPRNRCCCYNKRFVFTLFCSFFMRLTFTADAGICHRDASRVFSCICEFTFAGVCLSVDLCGMYTVCMCVCLSVCVCVRWMNWRQKILSSENELHFLRNCSTSKNKTDNFSAKLWTM